MKLFTLASGVGSAGWTLSTAGAEPGVVLGEDGRGRTLRLVRLEPRPTRGPCPRRGQGTSQWTCPECGERTVFPGGGPAGSHPDSGDVWAGSPASPIGEGSLAERAGLLYLGPAGDSPATRAGVIVRDHSGYRGGWELRGPRLRSCSEEGRPVVAGPCPGGCGVEGRQYGGTPPGDIHPKRGVYGPSPKPLLAGACAQGAAGRMGGGSEVLLVLDPGQGFSVHPWGRRAVGVICVTWTGEVLRVQSPEAVRAAEGRDLPAARSW